MPSRSRLASYLLLALLALAPAGSAQAIFQTAREGTLEQLQAAIRGGANVNARDPYGQTPLMYAAEHSTPEAVQALIAAGADANARTNANWTPLMYAARNPDPQVTQALLDAGADPYATGDAGITAHQISLDHENPAVTRLLDAALEHTALPLSGGDRIQVIDGPLRVRQQPGTNATSVDTVDNGATGTILYTDPEFVDGMWWWKIMYDSGASGWSAQGTNDLHFIARADPNAPPQQATPATNPTTPARRTGQRLPREAFFVDDRETINAISPRPRRDPTIDQMYRLLDYDCCVFLDFDNAYLIDGTFLKHREENPITGRTAYSASDHMEAYCSQVTWGGSVPDVSRPDNTLNPFTFGSDFLYKRPQEYQFYLSRPVIESRRDMDVEYRSAPNERPVLRQGVRLVLAADRTIFAPVLDPDNCDLAFFATRVFTQRWVTEWVDLGDRWGVNYWDYGTTGFWSDTIEIAK